MTTTPTVRADPLLRRAAAAGRIIQRDLRTEAFSAENLTSKPTPPQWDIIRSINDYQYRYVIAGNQSGKTSLAVREVTWFVEKKHPFFKYPDEWSPSEPLIIIVAGQDRAQLETIWKTRMLPFLEQGAWQEIRQGQQLAQVVHKQRQDRIIFLSHNLGSDHDIAHMQFYSAHFVWVDEMPRSIRVLEELQRRTDAKRAPFLITFTQKVRNDSIRRFVEAVDPRIGRIFRLNKLDNPVYADRKEEELAKLEGLSDAMKAAVLKGDWINSDSSIYEYIPDVHGGMPFGYTPSWRHVAVCDPANRSKTGLTMWAEHPSTGMWWCVYAEYIKDIRNPVKLVYEVEDRIAAVSPNIIDRIYDSSAAWFADTAIDLPDGRKIPWTPMTHKSNRKEVIMSNFQKALGVTVRIAEKWAGKLIDEITDYERSETNPTMIVGAQKYHLLDTAHYFVDRIPAPMPGHRHTSLDDQFRQAHMDRLMAVRKKQIDAAIGRTSFFKKKWTGW